MVCGDWVDVLISPEGKRREGGLVGRDGGTDLVEVGDGSVATSCWGSARDPCGSCNCGFSSKSIRVPIIGPFGFGSAVEELEERVEVLGGRAGGFSSLITERLLGERLPLSLLRLPRKGEREPRARLAESKKP